MNDLGLADYFFRRLSSFIIFLPNKNAGLLLRYQRLVINPWANSIVSNGDYFESYKMTLIVYVFFTPDPTTPVPSGCPLPGSRMVKRGTRLT